MVAGFRVIFTDDSVPDQRLFLNQRFPYWFFNAVTMAENKWQTAEQKRQNVFRKEKKKFFFLLFS